MPNNVMFVTSHTFILYTRLNFYILRHIGTIGRKFKNDAWIDLRRKLKNPQSPKNWTRQVVKLSDYSKGHLRTRRKGLIDMIRNHFLLYIRTQLVLICINLNFSATKIPNRKYQIECKKESAKANWKIFSLKQFFTQVFFGGTQIRKLSILSKRQANHVLFWKKNIFLLIYSFTILLSELLCYKNWEIWRDLVYHILWQLSRLSQTAKQKGKGHFWLAKFRTLSFWSVLVWH